MIKPEHLPDVVIDAAVAMRDRGGSMSDIIRTALNAWPGMSTGPNIYGRQDAVMHLPLPPQEGEETDWGKPQGKEEW